MPTLTVNVEKEFAVCADVVWSYVHNFCEPWHPAISSMTAEGAPSGHLVRAFKVHGEDKTYREQLTWYSHSLRQYRYKHLEGIVGVNSYVGEFKVAALTEDKCLVQMTANIQALEPRLGEIAAGTRAIFDSGLDALSEATIKPCAMETNISAPKAQNPIQFCEIKTDPRLALSFVEGPDATSNTLCLFLHGIGGGRGNWDMQLELAGEYCTTAALDIRGYGESKIGKQSSTVADYCSDILRVKEKFGADRLILCGLSYGAWIATCFATKHPDLVSSLFLAGGCTGMSEASDAEQLAFRAAREEPLKAGKTPADFAPDVLQVIAGPHATSDVKAALLQSMSAISPQTYADAIQCFTNPNGPFDFSTLTMPVVLVTGEHDKLAKPTEIENVARRIYASAANPNVRFEQLPEAGHVCNLEAPKAFNMVLDDLLKRAVR